ncbi:MAG: flagellar brake domain-containing protein, partial [Phycisphaerae bacterium]
MATSTAGASVDTLKTLEQACSRNVAADLHVLHPEQGVLTARTRLLSLIEGHVYMDRPQSIGRPLDLRSDQPVDIHFLLTGTRYAFRTRITRPACYVRLNASQQVLGAAAALPDEVKIQQRRADFRISLAARGDISILIHGGTDADGGSCRIDQPRVVGRLLNISAGGLGVRCD